MYNYINFLKRTVIIPYLNLCIENEIWSRRVVKCGGVFILYVGVSLHDS